jgi:hypothetical protein|tara:strand:+ start:1556 stop:1684 length:129 start_codon:yes stop_codon:yes gene_type:complete
MAAGLIKDAKLYGYTWLTPAGLSTEMKKYRKEQFKAALSSVS